MTAEFTDLLEQEWAGTLSEAGRSRLASLCQADPTLAKRLREERQLGRMLRAHGPQHAPRHLAASVLAALEAPVTAPARPQARTAWEWLQLPALRWSAAAAVLMLITVEAGILLRNRDEMGTQMTALRGEQGSVMTQQALGTSDELAAGSESSRETAANRRTQIADAPRTKKAEPRPAPEPTPTTPSTGRAEPRPTPAPEPAPAPQATTADALVAPQLDAEQPAVGATPDILIGDGGPAPVMGEAVIAEAESKAPVVHAKAGLGRHTALAPQEAPVAETSPVAKPAGPLELEIQLAAAPSAPMPAASARRAPGGATGAMGEAVNTLMGGTAGGAQTRLGFQSATGADHSIEAAPRLQEDATRGVELMLATAGGEIIERSALPDGSGWRLVARLTARQLLDLQAQFERNGMPAAGGALQPGQPGFMLAENGRTVADPRATAAQWSPDDMLDIAILIRP